MILSSRFERAVDVPVGCPQTVLRAQNSLLVGTLNLELGQYLRLRWLGIKIAKIIKIAAPDKVSSNLGLCYAGVYSGDLDGVNRPTGVALAQLVVNQVTSRQMSPHYFRNFTTPGTYSVFVTNNLANMDLEVVVTGAAKLYLD
jgi:hypothetical protein